MSLIFTALKLAWQEKACRWAAGVSFAILLPLYAATLPASLTGGRIGWVSLRLLTPELGFIALALALLLALTVALMVRIVRQGQRTSKSAATGGLLGGLVALITPLLCCSPILPLALGSLAVTFPALASAAGGRVQGFIATHEVWLLLAALALTALALYLNARRVIAGTCCRWAPNVHTGSG
ncbi:MAG: hypothetical protein EPN69_06615 [Rhodanobacter sp.]|nr:MAG: hypothetical protein EPN69_06615 [Rhodanobacter sp.]TAM40966.1 MAG: hypothetical protein EPN58_08755 [Rhodanobacter sp.]